MRRPVLVQRRDEIGTLGHLDEYMARQTFVVLDEALHIIIALYTVASGPSRARRTLSCSIRHSRTTAKLGAAQSKTLRRGRDTLLQAHPRPLIGKERAGEQRSASTAGFEHHLPRILFSLVPGTEDVKYSFPPATRTGRTISEVIHQNVPNSRDDHLKHIGSRRAPMIGGYPLSNSGATFGDGNLAGARRPVGGPLPAPAGGSPRERFQFCGFCPVPPPLAGISMLLIPPSTSTSIPLMWLA